MTIADESTLVSLLNELLESTRLKRLHWEKINEDPWLVNQWTAQYVSLFKKGRILIGEVYGDAQPPYKVVIQNPQGEIVAECNPEEGFPNDVIPWLYATVVRNTLKVDDTILGIIDEIKSYPPF